MPLSGEVAIQRPPFRQEVLLQTSELHSSEILKQGSLLDL